VAERLGNYADGGIGDVLIELVDRIVDVFVDPVRRMCTL
jgi:hypothetical protein